MAVRFLGPPDRIKNDGKKIHAVGASYLGENRVDPVGTSHSFGGRSTALITLQPNNPANFPSQIAGVIGQYAPSPIADIAPAPGPVPTQGGGPVGPAIPSIR